LSLTRIYLSREYKREDFILSTPKTHSPYSSLLDKLPKQKPIEQPQPSSFPTPQVKLALSAPKPLSPEPLPFSAPIQPNRTLPSSPAQTLSTNPLPTPQLAEAPISSITPQPEITVTVEKTKKSPILNLEPISVSSSAIENQTFKDILKKTSPEYALADTIPDDYVAKKLMNLWATEQQISPVVILSFDHQENHLNFLKNIAKAISLRFGPAKVVSASKLEKEKQWNSLLSTKELHLIIASDYHLYLQPNLMNYHKEEPKQGKHFLQQTPLLLLSDLDLYLKEPQLKSLLWRAICNELISIKTSSTNC
jgi:hypothetical protein